MSIKEDSELRHVLSHIIMAIHANAKGDHQRAIYEIDAVDGLVMWDTDEQMNDYLRSIDYGLHEENEEKDDQEAKEDN